MTETFPAFFAQAPTLRVRDPLAQFLGAATDGLLEYHYADAVRLAGHSCPTVAGAYLLTRRGLRALYGDDLPERGNIAVQTRATAAPPASSHQSRPCSPAPPQKPALAASAHRVASAAATCSPLTRPSPG